MLLLCVRGAQVVVSSGEKTVLAGRAGAAYDDGTGTNARFNDPYGVAVSPDGLNLFVADRGTSIRQVRVHV